MERELTRGDFTAKIQAQKITLQTFSFSPGEGEKIKHLLGITGNLASFNAIPPDLSFTPFQVTFEGDGKHFLHKKETPYEKVEFTFEDVDNLLLLIEDSIDSSVDIMRITPTIKSPSSPQGGDVIEGRG